MENNNTEVTETPADAENTENSENPNISADELAKLKAENTRLGKLVNNYAEKEKTAREAEAKQKGEFEKLYNEQKTAFDTLSEEAEKSKSRLASFEAYFENSYKMQTETLDAEKKALIEKLFDGKDAFEKFSLLSDVLATIAPKTPVNVGNTPAGGVNPTHTDDEKAMLEKGDFAGLLKLRNKI